MEPYGDYGAVCTHSGIKGWTLRISREPRKDDVITYAGLICFGEIVHCRIVQASPEGRSKTLAEMNRRFEEWVYEYVARGHSGDTGPGESDRRTAAP